MRIGVNASFINLHSGIATYCNNLIRNLQEIQNEHTAYEFFLSKESVLPGFFNTDRNTVNAYNIPAHNSLKKILWEHTVLPRNINRKNLDLYHGTAFSLPFGIKIPTVLTVHDLNFIDVPETIKTEKKIYYKTIIKNSIKKADHIITDSDFIKKRLIDIFSLPENKITPVYLGNEEISTGRNDNNRNSETLLKFSIKDRFFLFVGAFEPRKNIGNVFRAFSRIKDKTVKLVITGPAGWKNKDIYRLVETLSLKNKIIFTGEIGGDELQALYCSCMALVFPSIYEGFGLPVIEAMACGAPVITSNRASMPEVAGGAAHLVDPFSVNDIYSAMEKILSDEHYASELSAKGRKRAAAFSWEQCARETVKVYERVI